VFHDTEDPPEWTPERRRRHSLLPSSLLPSSGCPCRSTHSRSRLPRGEPGCRSALAEDPREPSQGRFDHPSVKTSSFHDLGHLPPLSTLHGCSSVPVALPPPHDVSSSLSPVTTDRFRVKTPGHTAGGHPPWCFARSRRRSPTSAIRFPDARATPRTPRPSLSRMPSGIRRPRSFVFRKRARRASQRGTGIAPEAPSGPGTLERGRAALGGT